MTPLIRSLLLLFCSVSGVVSAAHITDKLVVGLYPEARAEGTPIQLLSSGAPVEVLRRRDGFAEVRIANDKRGWVESRYVTDEKPAKAMLLETQARLRQMGLEIAALRAERDGEPLAAAEAAVPSAGEAGLRRELDASRARIAELEQQLDHPADPVDQAEIDEVRQRVQMALDVLAAVPGVKPGANAAGGFDRWRPWIVGLAALILGFVAGIAYVDHRLRRRYGGFRF